MKKKKLKKEIKKLKSEILSLHKENKDLKYDRWTLVHFPDSTEAQIIKFSVNIDEAMASVLWFGDVDEPKLKGIFQQIEE